MARDPAVSRPVSPYRLIGLLVFLLAAIPGLGEAGDYGEVREAVAAWGRVFGRLPALEQYVTEGKALGGGVTTLQATLDELSREEATNPFVPLARGAIAKLGQKGGILPAAAEASRLAGDRLAIRWLLYRAFRQLGEEQAAARELKTIREIRDRGGLDRVTYVGRDLIRLAEVLAERSQVEEAEEALTLAEEFDPDLPDVYFTRARIRFQRGSPAGLGSLIEGWWVSLSSPFYGPEYLVGLLAAGLLALPLGLLLVGLLLILRVTPLFQHDLAEWRRRKDPPGVQLLLPVVLYVLPLILGLGLLPAVLLALLPLGIYLSGRERIVWVGGVLSLLLLPGGYDRLALLITSSGSPQAVALLRLEEGDLGKGVEGILVRWTEEAPHDPLPQFYLGRLHRARGEYGRGITRYADARGTLAEDAAIWTNRGNLAFLAGDLPQAQAAYQRAITLNPDLPYPHFNLSQVFTEQLLLDQAQQEYLRAVQRMPRLQGRLRQATVEGRKRVLVDAPLPRGAIWSRMLGFNAPPPAVAEFLWGGRFLGVSLTNLPWAVGGYLTLFVAILGIRKRRRFARACTECGRSFCPRCQRLLGEIRFCTRCAIINRARLGEVPPTMKTVPAEEAKREHRWLAMALRLIPGMEGLYRGRTLQGVLLLAGTVVAVSPLLGRFLESVPRLTGSSLPYQEYASVAVLLCLYLGTAITMYGGRRHGRPRQRAWR